MEKPDTDARPPPPGWTAFKGNFRQIQFIRIWIFPMMRLQDGWTPTPDMFYPGVMPVRFPAFLQEMDFYE